MQNYMHSYPSNSTKFMLFTALLGYLSQLDNYCWGSVPYSLHQKKVSTCSKAKYSKNRVSTEKVGGASHP